MRHPRWTMLTRSTAALLLMLGLLMGAQAKDAKDAKDPKDGGGAAAKSDKENKRLGELRKQFQQRDPKLRELKKAGTIGETSDGLLDFVESRDAAAADVVADENKDRQELYAILAKEEGVEPSVVAARSARRNFQRARAGEYLKEAGKWKKKA